MLIQLQLTYSFRINSIKRDNNTGALLFFNNQIKKCRRLNKFLIYRNVFSYAFGSLHRGRCTVFLKGKGVTRLKSDEYV